jgi:hypothetical protein
VKKGLAPPARKGHSLVGVDSLYSNLTGTRAPALVLFGGRVSFKKYFNDVWAFFPSHSRWEQLDRSAKGISLDGHAPHPRDHHAAAEVGSNMYCFGGWYQYRHAFDDVWQFDLERRVWIAHLPSGPSPFGRFLLSMLSIGKRIYVFGGELGADAGSKANAYLNDVWSWDTESHMWTQLSNSRCPRDHSIRPRVPHAPSDDDKDDGERMAPPSPTAAEGERRQ